MHKMTCGVTFSDRGSGRWGVSMHGKELACSLSLEELIGSIDKPVIVAATGPSAATYPWDRIVPSQVFIVGVNGAPTLLEAHGLQADILVVSDGAFLRKGCEHLERAPGVPLVTTPRGAAILAGFHPSQLHDRPFAIIERVNRWHALPALDVAEFARLNRSSGSPFLFSADPLHDLKVGWSRDPSLGFFSGCTCTFAALQVVVGFGARDIEIVGMDLSSSGRCYAEGENPQKSSLELEYEGYIRPSFQLMHEALAGLPVHIRNHSPVCPLPREWFRGSGNAESPPLPASL